MTSTLYFLSQLISALYLILRDDAPTLCEPVFKYTFKPLLLYCCCCHICSLTTMRTVLLSCHCEAFVQAFLSAREINFQYLHMLAAAIPAPSSTILHRQLVVLSRPGTSY